MKLIYLRELGELLMNGLLIHIGICFAFVILEETCLGVKELSG